MTLHVFSKSIYLKLVSSLISLVALSFSGWILSYWAIYWFAPPVKVKTIPLAVPSVRAEASKDMFGRGAISTAPVKNSNDSMRLLGVFKAEEERRGYALLKRTDGKVLTILEGAEIAPGLRLSEVHERHVILNRQGSPEKLSIQNKEAVQLPHVASVKTNSTAK